MITHIAARDNDSIELLDVNAGKFFVSNNPLFLANFISEMGGIAENVNYAPSFLKKEAFGIHADIDATLAKAIAIAA